MAITIDRVTLDEQVNGLGDGDTIPDAVLQYPAGGRHPLPGLKYEPGGPAPGARPGNPRRELNQGCPGLELRAYPKSLRIHEIATGGGSGYTVYNRSQPRGQS